MCGIVQITLADINFIAGAGGKIVVGRIITKCDIESENYKKKSRSKRDTQIFYHYLITSNSVKKCKGEFLFSF